MERSNGRITFASSNSYTVLSECGSEYFSVLSGRFDIDIYGLPAVGDYVEFQMNESGQSIIEAILPRSGVVSRRSAGRKSSESILAANVDYMLIVNALDSTFSKKRIERFLVLAKSGGVTPVIILSKADICDPINLAIYLLEAEEAAKEVQIIELSSITGSGIEKVEALLQKGVTACAVGLSGAGKSTLLNRMIGSEVRGVSEVRGFDNKGKHCSTSRELFKLKTGASFIDTPGIREVGLTGDTEAVETVFDDVTSFGADCFFANCTHAHEPLCAVIEAVRSGKLDEARYNSYLKLRKESENFRQRTESPQEKKRADKRLSRLVRSEGKRKKKF
ncbi:MAG: ribosome small subunit-dependent GTPase A [Denitrovibrio sp.]|nr:MAG: ribosome small subunit-dependent GTPase A [Denitrovibrio sp.]